MYYEAISSHYGGWSLTEMKNMSAREREFWIALIKWRNERRAL